MIPSLFVFLTLSLHLKPDEKAKGVCHRGAPRGASVQMLGVKESTEVK